jgi:hypothetical protein
MSKVSSFLACRGLIVLSFRALEDCDALRYQHCHGLDLRTKNVHRFNFSGGLQFVSRSRAARLVSGFEAHARLSGEPARPNRRRRCSGTDSQGADDAGCGGSRCQYASAERIRSE